MPASFQTPRVFVSRKNAGARAAWAITIGAGLLLVLGMYFLYFLLLMRLPTRPNDALVAGIIGGASTLPVMLILYGWTMLRSTVRVVLDDEGVHLETLLGSRRVLWTEIQRVERGKSSSIFGSITYELIRIYGKSMKTVATISETIEDLDGLASEIASRAAVFTEQPTYDPAEDERRRVAADCRRVRRSAWALGFFALLMVAGLCLGVHERVHTRRYATEGTMVEAKVVRQWMKRVTPWLEYSFVDERGKSYSREITLHDQDRWKQLEVGATVPVEYLRSDPTWNRLAGVDDPDAMFGGAFVYICATGLVFFGTACVFAALGYDLRTGDEGTKLVRYGQVIRRWGPQKLQPRT